VAEIPWPGPPLVCPACREGAIAHNLDPALRCPACGEQYGSLEGTTIPRVLAPAAREAAQRLDAPGPLRPPGALGPWLRSVTPGSAAFGPLARAAIFLRAMAEGREEPFYTDLCDQLLPDLPGEALGIDLGCGAGNLAFELARRTRATIVGLDLDAHLLRWAGRAAAAESFEAPVRLDAGRFAAATLHIRHSFDSARLRLLCANLLDPPFAPATFDFVALVNVLDSVAHPAAALRQAIALLKPGGHLLFASPDSWNGATTPVKRWLATTEAGWDRVFERAGLETLRRTDDLEWRLQDTPRLHHLYRVHARLLRKS